MKAILIIFILLFMAGLATAAFAASGGPPPGNDNQIIYNKNGQWGAAVVGYGLSLSTTGGQKTLFLSGPTVPTTAIIEENNTPIITETGSYIVEE